MVENDLESVSEELGVGLDSECEESRKKDANMENLI